jgi:hypothetical protein
VSTAVSLASDASIVSLLGGGTGASTYSALGLLGTINTAGEATEPTTVPKLGTDVSQVAQLANDAGVVGTLNAGTTSASGEYSSSGALQNLSASVSATYGDILKTTPGLTATFVGASYNSGIINTIA